MTRTISGPTLAEIVKADTSVGWLVEIAFASFTGRYSSFGTLTWNSLTWSGGSLKVADIDTDASRARLSFFDPDAAIRTLCLTGSGARNAPIKIWKVYTAALGVADPLMMFKGAGDEVNIAGGRVDIACARGGVDVLMVPRRRLGPGVGCNFLAPSGTIIQWGGKTLRLESRPTYRGLPAPPQNNPRTPRGPGRHG